MNSIFSKFKYNFDHSKKHSKKDESRKDDSKEAAPSTSTQPLKATAPVKDIIPDITVRQNSMAQSSTSSFQEQKQTVIHMPSASSIRSDVTVVNPAHTTAIRLPSTSSMTSTKSRKPSHSESIVSTKKASHSTSKPSETTTTTTTTPVTVTPTATEINTDKPNKKNDSINLILKNDVKVHIEDDPPMFDPDPVSREEAEFCSHTIYLDDRSFMVDDEELDQEVSEINSKANSRSPHDSVSNADKSSISSHDSCHVVNEVQEGRISKRGSRNSSRASSLAEQEQNTQATSTSLGNTMNSSGTGGAGGGDASSENAVSDGCRNELLDTLIRKFNLNVEIDESNSNVGLKQDATTPPKPNAFQYASKIKNIMKSQDDTKKQRVGEIQKKIHRSQLTKQNTDAESTTSSGGGAVSGGVNRANRANIKDVKVNRLPQVFLCKYIGKTPCHGLWGVRHTREPIELLINAAKRKKTIDELPTVEAMISEKGIYVVQKLNHNKKYETNANNKQHHQPERVYRSGLIPIGNVSYGVQDSKYGKVFSCIVVRERETKTICECYAFLNSKTEGAKRMALSLTLAFKEYGKLLQIKESNLRHTIMLEDAKNRKKEPHDSMV